MGDTEETSSQTENQNGLPTISNGLDGGEIGGHRVSGDQDEGDTITEHNATGQTTTEPVTTGHCSTRHSAQGQTEEDKRIIDPIYTGLISCPRDPGNYYTLTAISMSALLKVQENYGQCTKGMFALKKCHSTYF